MDRQIERLGPKDAHKSDDIPNSYVHTQSLDTVYVAWALIISATYVLLRGSVYHVETCSWITISFPLSYVNSNGSSIVSFLTSEQCDWWQTNDSDFKCTECEHCCVW